MEGEAWGMGGEGRGGIGREGDRRGVLWTVESKKFLKIDPAHTLPVSFKKTTCSHIRLLDTD